MKRPVALLRAMVTIALCAVAVSACSTEDVAPQALPPEAERSFDLFMGDKLGLVDYAMRKARDRCLADAGFPQNLQAMEGEPNRKFDHLVVTARLFGPASEEEARRLGFGRNAPAEPPAIISFDPNYDRNLESCEKKAWQRLGKDGQQTYLAYFQLGNDLATFQRILDERLPADTMPKMFECMKGKGFTAVDPKASLRKGVPAYYGVQSGQYESGDVWQPERRPGTVQVGPAVPEKRYQPTLRESELAAAWYHCTSETKRIELTMRLAGEIQRELVSRHEPQFTELNPKLEALARNAASLINGG